MYVCMYAFIYVVCSVYMCVYVVFVVSTDLNLSTSDQASCESDRSQSIPLPEKYHQFLQGGGGRYPVVSGAPAGQGARRRKDYGHRNKARQDCSAGTLMCIRKDDDRRRKPLCSQMIHPLVT
jgi:hypothetical protein